MVTKKQWKMTFVVEDTAYNFRNGEPMDLRDGDDMKYTLIDMQHIIKKVFDLEVVHADVEEVKE